MLFRPHWSLLVKLNSYHLLFVFFTTVLKEGSNGSNESALKGDIFFVSAVQVDLVHADVKSGSSGFGKVSDKYLEK